MKKQTSMLAIIFFLSTLVLSAQSPADSLADNSQLSTLQNQTAKLTVVITDLDSDKGEIRIGLCNSKENYESDSPYKKALTKIKNNTATYTFENIPYGIYAVKFYHDENMNGKLDRNFFGMPKESYGFSNNATGNFGPPDFEDAKFTINKSELTIEISAQ